MRAWRRLATVAKAATTLCQNAAAQTTFAAAQLKGTQRLHVWQAQRAWPGSCKGTELRLPRTVRTAVSKRSGQQLCWVSFTQQRHRVAARLQVCSGVVARHISSAFWCWSTSTKPRFANGETSAKAKYSEDNRCDLYKRCGAAGMVLALAPHPAASWDISQAGHPDKMQQNTQLGWCQLSNLKGTARLSFPPYFVRCAAMTL